MSPDEIQKLYEEWPEDDKLLPFDDFLVGGAMAPAVTQNRASFNRQISGVGTVQELLKLGKAPDAEAEIDNEDDLHLFAQTEVELTTEEQYEQLYLTAKRRAFKIFNFLHIKSALKGNVPLSEKDLLLEEEDHYLLEYLRRSTKDYYRVQQIATLIAYREMGIEVAKFVKKDTCPVCEAHDGLFYNVSYLLDLLGSGSYLTHPSCDVEWFPVIHRESYVGPLNGEFGIDLEEVMDGGGRMLRNVPVELHDDVLKAAAGLPYRIVDFVNMAEYGLNEIDSKEDLSGAVVYARGDRLFVHNSYIGMKGPAQFIESFLSVQGVPSKADLGGERGEIFFVGGRSAFRKDGVFWDSETGDRLY
jgi:hypothetical protein